jgi:uncharacterized protein (TIGR02466 family)
MPEIQVTNLFPTPVYSTIYDKEFTKKEIDEVEKIKKESIKEVPNDIFNLTGDKQYILNRPVFKNLKNFIEKNLQNYLNQIVCAKDVECYITQSWFTVTRQGMSHRNHCHANSYLSGTFYMYDVKPDDKVVFHKKHSDINDILLPERTNFNLWNSETWPINAAPGKLLLFPSDVRHHVDPMQGNHIRTSLAFNTFLKGRLGHPTALSQLYLKKGK